MGQQRSTRIKRGQKRSTRVMKGQGREGSRRFKKVQERAKKGKEASRWFKKVKIGFRRV